MYGAALNAGLILTLRNLPWNASLGLAAVSHVEVVFLFHLARESEIATGCVVLAIDLTGRKSASSLSVVRIPNRIGVAICRLLSVENLFRELAGSMRSMVRRFWILSHIYGRSRHEATHANRNGLMNSRADTGKLQNSASGRIV
jgi:hypothetical protein